MQMIVRPSLLSKHFHSYILPVSKTSLFTISVFNQQHGKEKKRKAFTKSNMSILLLLTEEVNAFANSKASSLLLTPNASTLYQAPPWLCFPVD